MRVILLCFSVRVVSVQAFAHCSRPRRVLQGAVRRAGDAHGHSSADVEEEEVEAAGGEERRRGELRARGKAEQMEAAVSGGAAGRRWRLERLSRVYRCLQSARRPAVRAATLASLLREGLCEASPQGGGAAGSLELAGLSMTLVRRVAASLTARSLPPAVAPYFLEALQILVDEMGLISHLVSPSLQMWG